MLVHRQGRHEGAYVLLTGAGASISSGYPSGSRVRDEYLQFLYGKLDVQQLARLFQEEFGEAASFSAVSGRMKQRFAEDSMRAVIGPLFQSATPNAAYKKLSGLIDNRFFALDVFTTNWDPALETCVERAKPVVEVADMRIGTEWHFKIHKLHGTFDRPETLVWDQDVLRKWQIDKLRAELYEHPLLVIGYSASDRDVMDAILPAIRESPIREAWVVGLSSDKAPSAEIRSLLEAADKPNNYINASFDEFIDEFCKAVEAKRREMRASDISMARFVPFTGNVYRVVRVGFPWKPPQAMMVGGRFHSAGGHVLYAASTPELAFDELQSVFRPTAEIEDLVPPAARLSSDPDARPWTLVELKLNLHKCLDLRSEKTRREWEVDLHDLVGSDLSVSQGLAVRAREAGAEGIVAPSRLSSNAASIAVFSDALLTESSISIVRQLPMDD